MKYYQYISKSKIDMLLPQIGGGKLKLKGIAAKLQLGLGSISANSERTRESQVGRLEVLMQNLYDSYKIKTINSLLDDNQDNFIKDSAIYFSGVFFMDSDCDRPIATYVCWRVINCTILILIGSPSNIIDGSKYLSTYCLVPGTSGAHNSLYRFADKVLQTDENTLVRNTEFEFFGKTPRDYQPPEIMTDLEWDTFPKRSRRTVEFELEGNAIARSHGSDGAAIALMLLAFGPMSRLPEQNIEIAFRVFNKHNLPPQEQIKKQIKHYVYGSHVDGYLESIPLDSFDNVVIGSPIYTALC